MKNSIKPLSKSEVIFVSGGMNNGAVVPYGGGGAVAGGNEGAGDVVKAVAETCTAIVKGTGDLLSFGASFFTRKRTRQDIIVITTTEREVNWVTSGLVIAVGVAGVTWYSIREWWRG